MQALKKEVKPDGTIAFKGVDHAIDDLRYILMSRPQAAKNPDPPAKYEHLKNIDPRSYREWRNVERMHQPQGGPMGDFG